MRCFQIKEFGLDNLQMVQHQQPDPGPGEVLLKLEAASLNYRDLLVVQGLYNPRQPLPLIPCSDAAAKVEKLGPGVEHLQVGDKVCTLFCQNWPAGRPTRQRLRNTLGSPADGVLCSYCVLPAHGVSRYPEYLSPAEASTLPCAALTAWSALVTQAELSPGDTVLLLGTGGVSIWALQLAQVLGLRTIITSSSEAKLEQARALGADHTINYSTDKNWGKTAREMAGGEGVDLVVEVGGAGTLAQSLRSLRLGGQISLIGVLSGVEEPLGILPIVMGQIKVQGILVGHHDGFAAMCRALEKAKVKPVIDRVFPFLESRQAFEHLAGGGHLGKIVVDMSQ